MTVEFADKTAIAGIGCTEFSKRSGVTTLTLALRAIKAALDDAGLSPAEVDGLATFRVNDAPAVSVVAQALGVTELRYYVDQFGGGGSSHSVIGQAAMAVATGMANYVICFRSLNARSGYRMGGTGEAPKDSPEIPYLIPYGYFAPAQQYAMVARAYMERYRLTQEHLGAIAVNQRANAIRNPRAMMRTPMTYQDYLDSRMIAEPFRLFDCCLETDVGIAVLVCSRERANALRRRPVLISAAGWGGGRSIYSVPNTDPSASGSSSIASRIFGRAHLTPADVDVAMIYDSFTFAVLLQLEDYGFCGRGESGDFVMSGATRMGGAMPVNTHGGFLSEGYGHGMNHVFEAVEQLRGEAGERQVPDARVALSTGAPGYVGGLSSALLLRRAE